MRAVLIVLAILLLLPILRRLLAVAVLRVIGPAMGKKVLERQPDRIHLSPSGADPWNDSEGVGAIVAPLVASGFESAGIFRVDELPAVLVQLLARKDERLYAAVYEHREAGTWFDVVARYQDGTSMTFTTSPPTGLDDRPGHAVVHAPGSDARQILERARAEMANGWRRPVSTQSVEADFEEAYAESIAWRKTHGVSGREISQVAARKAA